MSISTEGAIIVTGAGRGIGAAVARMLGSRGVPVVVNFSVSREAAAEVVQEIASSGGRAIAVQADVAEEKDILRLFEAADREFGFVGGLVNNAGVLGGVGRLENLEAAGLLEVLRVNVAGTVLCSREAVCRMSTARGGRGGAIVNLSSLAARTGGPNEFVHYAASKGAIDSFTVGLAREVANEGIRVNAVAPGLIETEIHIRAGIPDRLDRLVPGVPMKRAGTAEEVAEGIVWLLSPEASYVTGSVLEIGGGR